MIYIFSIRSIEYYTIKDSSSKNTNLPNKPTNIKQISKAVYVTYDHLAALFALTNNIPVILVGVQMTPRRRFEPIHTPYKTPAMLYEGGVRFKKQIRIIEQWVSYRASILW